MSFGVKKNTPMRGRIPASRRKEKYRKIQIRPPSFPVFLSLTCTINWYQMTLILPHPAKESAEEVSPQANAPPRAKRMADGAPWWEHWRTAPSTGQEAGERGPLHTVLPLSLPPRSLATFEIWTHLLVLILSSREPSNNHVRYPL